MTGVLYNNKVMLQRLLCCWALVVSFLLSPKSLYAIDWYSTNVQLGINKQTLVSISGNLWMHDSVYWMNEGNILIASSCLIDRGATVPGDGRYTIGGNWFNNGSFNPGHSRVDFNGGPHQIAGISRSIFYDIFIQNADPVFQFSAVDVTDSLGLSGSNWNMGKDTLRLLNPDTGALQCRSSFPLAGVISGQVTSCFWRAMKYPTVVARAPTTSCTYFFPFGDTLPNMFRRALWVSCTDTTLCYTGGIMVHQDALLGGAQPLAPLPDAAVCAIDTLWYYRLSNSRMAIPYSAGLEYHPGQDPYSNAIAVQDSLRWDLVGTANASKVSNGVQGLKSSGFPSGRSSKIYTLAKTRPIAEEVVTDLTPCLNTTSTYHFPLLGPSRGQFIVDTSSLNVQRGLDTCTIKITWKKAGPHVLREVITDTLDQCASTPLLYNFNVDPGPVANFSIRYDHLYAGLPVSFVDSSKNASSWLWSFQGESVLAQHDPTAYFEQPGQYPIKLVVSDPLGCQDSITRVLSVGESIFIPNVFTPNGDGINDCFEIQGMGIAQLQINIFNRWGEVVYHSAVFPFKWEGMSSNQEPCPSGTYFYQMNVGFADHIANYNGDITLLR